MTTEAEPLALDEQKRDALAERLFLSGLAGLEILTVYLGKELGYYDVLATKPHTARELADATGTTERYAREWLEQQAAAGIIEHENNGESRFWLSPEGAEVLVNEESLSFMAWLPRFQLSWGSQVPALLKAFHDGSGIPYADYGLDMVLGQAGANRPAFMKQLATEWLPKVPGLLERLQRPGARIADIGCGTGWSTIALGQAFPGVIVDGYDLDETSIQLAEENLRSSGIDTRVTFHRRDVATLDAGEAYDLITIFEALHDLSRPIEFLASARRCLADDGYLIVMDERVAETFEAPTDEVERFMYACSVLHCLPASLAEYPSAATGTVIRPDVVREYARQAGFREVEILPIETDFFRFYLLRP